MIIKSSLVANLILIIINFTQFFVCYCKNCDDRECVFVPSGDLVDHTRLRTDFKQVGKESNPSIALLKATTSASKVKINNVTVTKYPKTTITLEKTSTTPKIKTKTKDKLTTTTMLTTTKAPVIVKACVGGFEIDTLNNTICIKDADGKQRKAEEVDCVFPFKYKNVWRDKCIKNDRNHNWCSIDRIYNNRYARCEKGCPLLARQKLKDSPANTIHTTCLNSKPGIKGYFPTSAEIRTIINLHNKIRSDVTVNATNMRILTWDIGLARLAQRWAESGTYGHDCHACRTLVNNRSITIGQNGYLSFGLKRDGSLWKNVINAWDSEKMFFKYGTQMDIKKVGHYTQIINSGVSRIGCGAAGIGGILLAYCNYAMGQYDIEKPYEEGKICSKCSKSNCKNKLCNCRKFCQNYGTLDEINCKCLCQPYATGEECEKLVCSKSDYQYGCYVPNDTRMCIYIDTIDLCPHTCGICSHGMS